MKEIKAKRTTKVNKKIMSLIVAMSLMILGTVGAFATSETPTLDINFDVSEMFTWAQTIINAMMPVLYIIMGVALGFLIINAFKRAFN